jgi:DNA-directed RNA polymerase subunit H (RpoH/RPB5)
MATSNNEITSIYNSRKTLLEIFGDTDIFWFLQQQSIQEYRNFTINEVEAMAKNNQLDMLLKSEIDFGTTYIKYMMNKSSVRLNVLDDLVEELFEIEGILGKKDTLVIVINDEPNDSMIAKLSYLYDNKGYFVVAHNINRLQRNIMKHTLVPKHTIVLDTKPDDETETMVDKLIAKYNLKSLSQLPEISRFDPVALLICLRPGQICEITRKSPTSITSLYYRICV